MIKACIYTTLSLIISLAIDTVCKLSHAGIIDASRTTINNARCATYTALFISFIARVTSYTITNTFNEDR